MRFDCKFSSILKELSDAGKRKLARINELARKAKEGALTPEEAKDKRNYAKNIYRPSVLPC